MLKYLVLLFVVATVFGEPEPSAVADAAPKADADPWYYYGGYPYAHYGYYGYPYAHYLGRKRRSEPEPDANAYGPAKYYPYGYYGHVEGTGDQQSPMPDAEPAAEFKPDPAYILFGIQEYGPHGRVGPPKYVYQYGR